MPQTSLNSRILQEINVNIRSADQPGSRIPLNFGGDVGVGNPKKNLQVFTHSHLISYLSCADNRIHLYNMIRKHLKSKHVFWYYVPKLCSPFILEKYPKDKFAKSHPSQPPRPFGLYVPPGGLYGIRTPPEGDVRRGGQTASDWTLQWGTWWMNLYD